MSKKNRAKSKAKRFGEGSAKPIVSAATYGVGGNAFAQAIADPVSTVHSNKPELLVVDGYNVIHCTPRYEKLVYDHSDDPYSSDVHDMARTALINDVAAFAQGRYEAVIVFDGAGNISSERPNLPARGVRIKFSPTGVSADTVVQKLCIEAREEGRACSVVSSDGTIQAVVMGKGVTRISSRMLVDEIKQIDNDVHEAEEAPQIKMTLGSRLSPEALAKLKALRESWANTCNARLDETARIDHRSLEDQGSDLEPTIHEGYAARAIERAGGVSERCQTNREIRRSNSLLTAVRAELGRIFDRLGELFAAKIGRLRRRQARPEPAEPNWRYFEGDARRQLEADKADHTAAIRGKLMDARADVGNREEWWRSHGTEEHEAAKQIIDVARAASREARDANIFKRGRLLRNAEQVAGEQSERLRGAVPWLEDADIPADWDQANRFRMRTTKAIYDHDMQPRTRLVAELERRLEQAERAESERPSPEQVKALALRMAEQRAQAENPTQDTKRPAPSGDEPLDLSEPEDWGEASPFESRQALRTKADLLNEIRQRMDRLTGQREAEQRQIDPWQVQPPQRRGHGR